MNIILFSLVVFSSAFTIKGELQPSVNYLKAMSEQLSKEKCTYECRERKEGCKEYLNHLALCESIKEKIYEENYDACFCDCKNSVPSESAIACSYSCIRSGFKMENIKVPGDFSNGFIDSLVERESNLCTKKGM